MFVVTVDDSQCIGCGQCAKGCPGSVFTIVDKKAVSNDDGCLGCQSCISICPVGAVIVDEY